MPPDGSEKNYFPAHLLRLIHPRILLRKVVDTYFKRPQVRYIKDIDEHFQSEPHFVAGDQVFIERFRLMVSAVDRTAYEGYSNL